MSMADGVWKKSTYSNQTGGECVECRSDDGRVLVRDSQHPTHGHLAFPGTEWAAFIHAVREGGLGR
jgi:hypothetical protein